MESLPADPRPEQDARQWAVITHLASFTGYLTGIGFVVGPLIAWLIKKDQLEYADDQGKEALNFNLSLFLYSMGALVLAFTIIGLVIAIPAWIAIWAIHLIFTIVAAVNAGNGIRYRYPLTIRLVK